MQIPTQRLSAPHLRAACLALSIAVPGGAVLAQETSASVLESVTDRGRLVCGVNAGLAGFASVDANNLWSGFEVDFCRAVAAATLGDPGLVDLVPLPVGDRFASLVDGEVDLVSRGPAWSITPDVGQGVTLAAVSYFDQLGFLLPVEQGITSPRELGQSSICVLGDLTTGPSLDDYFRSIGQPYLAVPAASDADARRAYVAAECDSYARPAAELHSVRASFEAPGNHMILADASSRLPSGPVVRQGDEDWADVVRWTYLALLAAEEQGVTSANVREMAATPVSSPEINRLLGTEGSFGAMLGLRADWAVNAIAAGGNYGEIYERNIGENTPIGLARGLNALWTRGGLQYTAPFR